MESLEGRLCPFCGEGYLQETVREQSYHYHGRTCLLEQPGLYCSCCDESLLESNHLKSTRKALQAFRAQVDGLLGPDEIRRIRKQIGITQRDAGELFGGGKNAFSRYEQGEVAPPRSLSLLLMLISKHPELSDEL